MKRRCCASVLLCLLLCGCGSRSEPEGIVSPPEFVPGDAAVESFPYTSVKVYRDGLLTERGIFYSGSIMLPAISTLASFGIAADVEYTEDGFVLTAGELELQGSMHREYMTADGRYLYAPGGYLCDLGELWLPCEVLSKLLGVKISSSPELLTAEINSVGMNLLKGGEDYYTLNISSDDLYWLSRIIHSEAPNEPLAGMIGVGNVVMNRVESTDFPTTVFDVVFDRQYGVQFEPVSAGGIYDEPDELSVIAAYLCFEGYNTVGSSLYFVNPEKGGSWFDDELQLVTVIGGHNFYCEKQED